MARTAHNHFPKCGGFSACQLFGHELETPEGEPLDPEREGLDLTSYMAGRFVRHNNAYNAWLDAEAEHRVSQVQDMRTRILHFGLVAHETCIGAADVDRS